MKFPTTIDDIVRLPVEERIRIVQAILDTIATEESVPDPTTDQLVELDRRVAELDANPNNTLTWNQIKVMVNGQ
jgi:putative addiction module component (TIGR02574 family)